MKTSNGKKLLVSGASFAGLASAWWMTRLGHDVTLVEIAPRLRTGGTAVDIRGNTVDIVRRMGLLAQIRAHRLNLRRWEFRNADDRTERAMQWRGPDDPLPDDEFEIERDVLLALLDESVRGRCKMRFDDTVTGLRDVGDGIEATFANGAPVTFDLVLGCDGVHSAVRTIWFGEEARYLRFLQQYFSITIVDKLLIESGTAQMFNVPGKAVMLNAYKNKTDIIFSFASDREIPHDYRDESLQRRMIAAQFGGEGWRIPELLKEIDGSRNFYFDKLCQIRMPSWSKGRVVLVGDAAYCASPAAGMGGSLALDGAAALGDAMQAAGDDHALAFSEYEKALRPFVDDVQEQAVRTGLETLVPRTEEAIRQRNAKTGFEF